MSPAPAPVLVDAFIDLRAHLADVFAAARAVVAPEQNDAVVTIERPKQAAHGDYSCNLALQLAKPLKRNPREVAQALIAAMPASPHIAKAEIAGAGFINVFIAAASRQALVPHILNAGIAYGKNNSGANRKMQIEFVSANPTGPLHVGHGRGAAIGDSLARIFAANGWNVTREFYYNDAGQQIDNLMHSVRLRCLGITPGDLQWPEDGYRGDYIIDVARAYLARETVVADDQRVTSAGDVHDIEAIRHFAVAYLRREQDLDLRAFGVHFDVYALESALYANGKVEATVKRLIANRHTYEHDGALWLRTTDFGDDKDRVMRKAEGGYTYFVPDVAYHLDKWQRGFTRVINEQGADHHSTITRVRAGLQALDAGIPPAWPEYVLHQMVRVMKNGAEVKISKRAGSYVTLRDLIDETSADAVRYFLVARAPDSQLVFDIDLAKAQTTDNPVYYIQYAHARICSLVAQWQALPGATPHDAGILTRANAGLLNETAELALLARLADFPETVAAAARDCAPHLIAFYLKDLAADFHSYYNATRLITDDGALTQARIALAVATRTVLRNGLSLLGVSAPEKM